MGWLFNFATKAALVEHLLSDRISSKFFRADYSLRGNRLWVLYQDRNSAANCLICLYMLEYMAGEGPYSWGYKSLEETMGPNATDCPERILAKSTCNDEYAVQWRAACREARRVANNQEKAKRALKPGDTFVYNGKPITFEGLSGGRIIGVNENGQRFRYKTGRIEVSRT